MTINKKNDIEREVNYHSLKNVWNQHMVEEEGSAVSFLLKQRIRQTILSKWREK